MGLFQTPEAVAAAAVDEDADVVGISILSGAHMALVPVVLSALAQAGADIPVIVGGIIPSLDIPQLLAAGVSAVLTPGTTGDRVVEVILDAVRGRAA
jgi:methylmalonyl-CoA mutase C-terminal domain/subunit